MKTLKQVEADIKRPLFVPWLSGDVYCHKRRGGMQLNAICFMRRCPGQEKRGRTAGERVKTLVLIKSYGIFILGLNNPVQKPWCRHGSPAKAASASNVLPRPWR